MKCFYFTLGNSKSRRFIVQCGSDEIFFGFMFGIAQRARENNLWFTIADDNLNAEFRQRTSKLGSENASKWVNRVYAIKPRHSRVILNIDSKKHGPFTCLIEDVRLFMNGFEGSKKLIEGLSAPFNDATHQLQFFKQDVKEIETISYRHYDGPIDGLLVGTLLFIKKEGLTDFGRTSCFIAELIK